MRTIANYLPFAKANEEAFREILRDLKNNRAQRPMGAFIPKDLETELPLEEIFKKYSSGNRMGHFTISNFSLSKEGMLEISFEDVAPLSGGGGTLLYKLTPENKVSYHGKGAVFMC